ncbi:hypothetical protein [Jannaschia sp. W003]|uniref:hypothetical protein n=1 Tax=Jannaschia sp. W003 TaxID=2867012 RepID=UPI0021A5CDA1|nr:hypothetical protein [Jannaschia sp. W003]UWQ20036.1 hypothetical protein K3554_08405 [Jannaschia sp. W003]
MRTAITATALALALAATGAQAYTGVSPTLLADAQRTVSELGLDVDFDALTDEQVIEIYFAGSEDMASEKIRKIEAALNGEGTARAILERRVVVRDVNGDGTVGFDENGLMPQGENSVVASVQNYLDVNGFDVDASTLTDAQVAEIYLTAFGDQENGMEPSRDRIETFLDM